MFDSEIMGAGRRCLCVWDYQWDGTSPLRFLVWLWDFNVAARVEHVCDA